MLPPAATADLISLPTSIDAREGRAGDVCDAGMMYDVITADQPADPGDLTTLLGR
jgi:hypothetical protein